MNYKLVNKKSFIFRASISMFVKSFSVLAMFLMTLIISRSLDIYEAGLFFLGFTVITLLSSFGRIGLEQTLVKKIAIFKNINSFPKLQSLYRRSMLLCATFCVFISLLLIFLWDPFISNIFGKKEFKSVFFIMMLCLPFFSLNSLNAFAFQGLEKITTSLILLSILIPIQVSTYVYVFEISSATQTAWAFLCASLIAFIIGAVIWLHSVPKGNGNGIVSNKSILRTSIPLWIFVVVSQLIQFYSQLILGIYGSISDVAILAVSQRISLLVSLMLLAINYVVSPILARLYDEGNIEEIKKLCVYTVRILLAVGLPVISAIIIFPSEILSLFGKEYTSGAIVLIILVFGQLINVMTGSVGFLLSMTKYENVLRNQTMLTALVVLPLGVYLISSFGLFGAAITTSISIALHNLLLAFSVHSKLGINVFKFW